MKRPEKRIKVSTNVSDTNGETYITPNVFFILKKKCIETMDKMYVHKNIRFTVKTKRKKEKGRRLVEAS